MAKLVDLPPRDAYDRWAPTYDLKPNPLALLDGEVLARHLASFPAGQSGLSALDLGCGTGRNIKVLVALGAKVTAVDISERMLERAREKAGMGWVRFVNHDASQSLPFETGAFDIVISNLVMSHFENPRALFAEVGRVSAPGAWIYASGVHPSMWRRGGAAQFSDRTRNEEVRPKSYAHELCDYESAIREAGLLIMEKSEHYGTEALATLCPKARAFLGSPMLVVFVLGNALAPAKRAVT